MGFIVAFDYTVWSKRFPALAAIDRDLAQMYFDEATLYWNNNGGSPASTAGIQSLLMNLMTAHVAALNTQSQGDESPGSAKDANSPVGRVASATQGSVTVQTAMDGPPAMSKAWFDQTQYGSSFWAATAQYRTARPIAGALQYGGLPGNGGIPGGYGWNSGWIIR